jgi:hypothetical protein
MRQKEGHVARQLDFDEITIGMEIPFEEDVRLPDGTVGHFHLENPVVDNDGKVIGFVVSFHEEGDDEDEFYTPDGEDHHHG